MSTQKKLSLAPLKFKEAVGDLLKVKPEPKQKLKPKRKLKKNVRKATTQ